MQITKEIKQAEADEAARQLQEEVARGNTENAAVEAELQSASQILTRLDACTEQMKETRKTEEVRRREEDAVQRVTNTERARDKSVSECEYWLIMQ